MNAVGMAPAPTSPRPRSRGFSFRSDRSGGSKPKEDINESPRDKERRDTLWKSSKANPNAALTESQPAVANLLEESTLQSLRAVQHRDGHGNLITDPDLSNPTRPRLERPLDTIRSFERAVDQGYRRRTSYNRAESYDQSGQNSHSRRNSYYGNGNGYDNGSGPSRHSQVGGYYGNQRDSYAAGGQNGNPRMRQGPPRQNSDYAMNGQRPYGQHNHQPSQDTMNTHQTSGSDTTGPWASGTDPSSDNSSMERISNRDSGNNYSWSNPNASNNASGGYYNNTNNSFGPSTGGAGNGFQGAIPEEGGAYPFSQKNQPGRPIPLGNSHPKNTPLPSVPRPEPEKRKSWLQRRFSKKE